LFAMSDLHEKVRHTIKKFDLLRAGDTVVVAVSGGADSVALLHLLRGLQDEYALALHIAHLNHRLRPEAGADAEFVRQMAVNLGIPVTVEEVERSDRWKTPAGRPGTNSSRGWLLRCGRAGSRRRTPRMIRWKPWPCGSCGGWPGKCWPGSPPPGGSARPT